MCDIQRSLSSLELPKSDLSVNIDDDNHHFLIISTDLLLMGTFTYPLYSFRCLPKDSSWCPGGIAVKVWCVVYCLELLKTPKVVSLQFFWSSCPENYFQPFWLCGGGEWEQELLLWPWALLAFWFVVSLRQLEKATFFNSYLVLHQAPQV